MDSEVHGRIPLAKNKIDVFDVRILPDKIYLYWITTPNKSIQQLVTTTFNSNFKRKAKRATEQEPATIVRNEQCLLFLLLIYEIHNKTVFLMRSGHINWKSKIVENWLGWRTNLHFRCNQPSSCINWFEWKWISDDSAIRDSAHRYCCGSKFTKDLLVNSW